MSQRLDIVYELINDIISIYIPRVDIKDAITIFEKMDNILSSLLGNDTFTDLVNITGMSQFSYRITHPFKVTTNQYLSLDISFNIMEHNLWKLRVHELYVDNKHTGIMYDSDRFMDIKTDITSIERVIKDILSDTYFEDKQEYRFPMFNKINLQIMENLYPTYCDINTNKND